MNSIVKKFLSALVSMMMVFTLSTAFEAADHDHEHAPISVVEAKGKTKKKSKKKAKKSSKKTKKVTKKAKKTVKKSKKKAVKHKHKYSWTTTRVATCNQTGSQIRRCSCGRTYGKARTIKKKAHKYSWVRTVNPTEQANGQEVYRCNTCGAVSKTRSVAKLPVPAYKTFDNAVA